MKKKILTAVCFSCVLGLLAEPEQASFDVVTSGWWKNADTNAYFIQKTGKEFSKLTVSVKAEAGCYYMLGCRIKCDMQNTRKTLSMQLEKPGNPVFYKWMKGAKDFSPRKFYFFADQSGTVKISFYMDSKSFGNWEIEDLNVYKLTDQELKGNLFCDPEFETDSSVYGDWNLTQPELEPSIAIDPNAGCLTGKQSLRIDCTKSKNRHNFHSLEMPVLPGKTYELSFWAKSTSDTTFFILMYFPKNGMNIKHFSKYYSFRITPDWKQYTCKITIPEDEKEFPALLNRVLQISLSCENNAQRSIYLDNFSFRQIVPENR